MVIDGIELVGSVPVSLYAGDVLLELTGQDRCIVEATLEGGGVSELTLDVDNVPDPPSEGGGVLLGPEVVELGKEIETRETRPQVGTSPTVTAMPSRSARSSCPTPIV